MNTATSPRFSFPDTDRIGVAASVLCAIHCGLAPILLIFLPTFGKIWAHPASHALVAIFIVPLAILSIHKGYKRHRKRWILFATGAGVLCVLIGAALPALTKESAPSVINSETTPVISDSTDCSSEGCSSNTEDEASEESAACIDNCCPSAQISESGEISLHIPPAAIVTTLGGVFLIAAHIGNIIGCRHCDCCQTA